MGATGAVGQVMLEILAEREFPVDELRLLASSRSAGKQIEFQGDMLTVQELGVDSFSDIDLVLASAGGSLSKQYAPHAVSAGALVVDTSAFRWIRRCRSSCQRLTPAIWNLTPESSPIRIAQPS